MSACLEKGANDNCDLPAKPSYLVPDKPLHLTACLHWNSDGKPLIREVYLYSNFSKSTDKTLFLSFSDASSERNMFLGEKAYMMANTSNLGFTNISLNSSYICIFMSYTC